MLVCQVERTLLSKLALKKWQVTCNERSKKKVNRKKTLHRKRTIEQSIEAETEGDEMKSKERHDDKYENDDGHYQKGFSL